MRKKITIVGVGHVGATAAQLAAYKELGDIILIDIIEGVPQGKGLDLQESAPLELFDSSITGTNDYRDTADSSVVVITAGIPRKPGMSREDLLDTNVKIVRSVTEQVIKYSPDAFIIVVSNPLDAMCYVAMKVGRFDRHRIIGLSGVLDSARMRTFIAKELNVSMDDVQAMVLGLHGDAMIPLPRYSTVSGISITELLSEDKIDRIIDRTRKGGGEVVNYLKTGSAYYAPGAAIVQMIESVVKDKKRVLPCAAYLEGEYGIHGIFMGVPLKLGANGIDEIIQVKLTGEEMTALHKSAEEVKKTISQIKL
ncbi:MAG: malate dehydrogenase [Nitrospinota bacterium]|jgi:malate dehydrogenase